MDSRRQLAGHFGPRLVGLYLFGSLAAGDFYAGRSDLDLFAVLDDEVTDAEIDALREMHERFEADATGWDPSPCLVK